MSKIVITFPHLRMLLEAHSGFMRTGTEVLAPRINLLNDLIELKLVETGRTLYFTSFEANVMISDMAQLLVKHERKHNETHS